MKHSKLISLLLALAMVFALAACSGSGDPQGTPSSDPGNTESLEPSNSPETPQEVDLTILYEQDDSMINTYSLLAVNPDAPFLDDDGNAVSDDYV